MSGGCNNVGVGDCIWMNMKLDEEVKEEGTPGIYILLLYSI